MSIKDYCLREVVTIGPMESIVLAADRMLDQQIGCLVVAEEDKPLGILTDRDILREVVAKQKDPKSTCVNEIMTSQLVTVTEDAGVFEVIYTLREQGIRRLPIVNKQGRLAGIVTLDDLLILMGTELVDLAGISVNERNRESEKLHKTG